MLQTALKLISKWKTKQCWTERKRAKNTEHWAKDPGPWQCCCRLYMRNIIIKDVVCVSTGRILDLKTGTVKKEGQQSSMRMCMGSRRSFICRMRCVWPSCFLGRGDFDFVPFEHPKVKSAAGYLKTKTSSEPTQIYILKFQLRPLWPSRSAPAHKWLHYRAVHWTQSSITAHKTKTDNHAKW